MAILKGQTDIAVTATAQTVPFATAEAKYTLVNTGSSSIMYVHSPPHGLGRTDDGVNTTTFVGASVAALQALGGSQIAAGEAITVGPDVPGIIAVCITGETSTLEIVAGERDTLAILATMETSLDAIVTALGGDLTTTRVKIDQTAAAGVTTLIAALSANYSYLHCLWGTMAVGGAITIEDTAGTDLAGPMPCGANGGFVVPPERVKALCLRTTAVNKGLQINTTQKFYGYAIVSQATAD